MKTKTKMSLAYQKVLNLGQRVITNSNRWTKECIVTKWIVIRIIFQTSQKVMRESYLAGALLLISAIIQSMLIVITIIVSQLLNSMMILIIVTTALTNLIVAQQALIQYSIIFLIIQVSKLFHKIKYILKQMMNWI